MDSERVQNGTTNGKADFVEVDINYYSDKPLGVSDLFMPGSAGALRRKLDTRKVQVRDIRGHENEFDIHKQSFQLYPFTTAVKEYTDEEIRRTMYPEVEELLKKVTGATKVCVMSHLIRGNTVESHLAALATLEAAAGPNGHVPDNHVFDMVVPARLAHIDRSQTASQGYLERSFPEEADRLSKTRWGTINVWKPLKTIRRDPLAICDSRSVLDEDLVPVTLVLPGHYDANSRSKGIETLHLRANPDHQWWYASELTPEEALIFKISDSKLSIKGRVPHTSFVDPRTKDMEARKSIELRSFVFYEDQPAE